MMTVMTSTQWEQAKALYAKLEALTAQERTSRLTQSDIDEVVRNFVTQMFAHPALGFLENSPLDDLRIAVERETNLIGECVGGYTLQEKIGQGGMATVWRGSKTDGEVEHQAAIKLLRRGFPDDKRRFRRERKILANLKHPNIAQLQDSNTMDHHLPYLVMEYVKGVPITEYCDQKKLSIPARLKLFCDVCIAVHAAHQKMVIHRDIKPTNILVTADGQVKVLDFGIAKLIHPDDEETEYTTKVGEAAFTPEYASPEQLREQNLTPGSDVYSLGVVLYELLTGHRPYFFPNRLAADALDILKASPPTLPSKVVLQSFTTNKNPHTAIASAEIRQGNGIALSRTLRGDLDNILIKTLHFAVEERYQSVEQLQADITHYLKGEPVIARKPTYIYRASRYVKRNQYLVALSLIILALTTGWGTNIMMRFAKERDQAQQIRRKLYRAEMQQAQQNLSQQDIFQLEKTLSHWSNAAEGEDLRGFEWYYLWRFVHPEQLAVSMGDAISIAQLLPETNRLYVRDVSGARKVFDATTGNILWSYQEDPTHKESGGWPSHGEVFALESDYRIIVWDVQRGRKKFELTDTDAPLVQAALIDEKLFLTVDRRGTIKVRDRANGTLRYTFTGLEMPLTTFLGIGETSSLALVSNARTVTLQPFEKNKPIIRFQTTSDIKSVSVDNVQQKLLLHINDGIVIHNSATGKFLTKIPAHNDDLTSCYFPKESPYIFLNKSDHTTHILAAQTQQEMGVLRGHQRNILTQSFIPARNWFVSSSDDRTARLWEITTKQELATFRGHTGTITNAVISADNKKLITGSQDHTVRIWDVAQAMQPSLLRGHTAHILTAAFSPDNQHIATAGKDKVAIISNIETGKQLFLRGHQAMIFTVAFSPDGKCLASGSDDGTVKLWDATTGQLLQTIHNGTRQYKDGVRNLIFTRDGHSIIAGCNDGMIKVWERVSGNLLAQFRAHENEVLAVALSPDGKLLASSGADRVAKIWNVATWQERVMLTGHQGWVWATEFSPDGKQLATGSGDYKVRLWDVSTGQLIRTLEGHSDGIFSLAFTPDGKRVATCSDDKTVRIWNPATGEELLTLRDHTDEVWRVAFSSDGNTLLSASWDHTAQLYRAATMGAKAQQ